jgi:hypothetical protein
LAWGAGIALGAAAWGTWGGGGWGWNCGWGHGNVDVNINNKYVHNIAGMRPMGIGAQRINLAEMLASSRVIARAQVIDQVAVLELAAESLAIDQAAARARVIVRGPELGLAIVLAAVPVLIIAPAQVPVLAIVQAEVRVLIIVPAAVPVPAIVPAEVPEPEIVQVEEVPVRSHLPARLAVPLRTKSVIALHRRGRVPLLAAVEDLTAEVAEIMHAQAATEAARVWAAAVTAVAAAPE